MPDRIELERKIETILKVQELKSYLLFTTFQKKSPFFLNAGIYSFAEIGEDCGEHIFIHIADCIVLRFF